MNRFHYLLAHWLEYLPNRALYSLAHSYSESQSNTK
jgi:hypothetical protein